MAIIGGGKAGSVFIGGLERGIKEAPVSQCPVADGGGPAVVRGNGEGLHQLGRCPHKGQVGVALGGSGIRVKIPQVDSGQPAVLLLLIQIMGVQDKKYAGHRLDAQGADELRRGGFQQGIGRVAAAVQRAQADLSLVQKLLGQTIDGIGKAGQLLCIVEDGLKIPAAVVHLHGKDILGVLVQLGAKPGGVDGKGQQQELHRQHSQQGEKDGAEDRMARLRGLLTVRLAVLHLRVSPFVVVPRASQPAKALRAARVWSYQASK